VGTVDAKVGELNDRPFSARDCLLMGCHVLVINYGKEYRTRAVRPVPFLGPKAAPVK
jgi:hypothetical protein